MRLGYNSSEIHQTVVLLITPNITQITQIFYIIININDLKKKIRYSNRLVAFFILNISFIILKKNLAAQTKLEIGN